MRRLTTLILGLLLLFASGLQALEVPPTTGYVNDRAGILSPATKQQLEQGLSEFERSDSTQLVVLTIPSLEGEVLEEYSLKVAESWGIGQRGKDNGALLLIARDERKIRIEVGYGLEGQLTDLLTGRIIDQEITPRFRSGDYDGGVMAGVNAMAQAVRGAYQGKPTKKRSSGGFFTLLLFLAPWLLLAGPRRSSRRRSGIWFGGGGFGGGGGFSGGGGGFSGGGGGFGGGGSSGGW
ncbi:MAG: YgcG family protein [Pedobacter sp.]